MAGFETITFGRFSGDHRGALVTPDAKDVSGKEAKDAHESGELQRLWRRVKEVRGKLGEEKCTVEEHDAAVEDFFAWQRKSERLDVLKTSEDPELVMLKHELLDVLRSQDVFVLERGAIEDYYPDTIQGADKPSRAQDFCQKVATPEDALASCGVQSVERNGAKLEVKEFQLIFEGVFGGMRGC